MNNETRLHLLIDRYFDEALTVDEAAELNQMLANSEEAREEFWRTTRFHARLRQWGEQQLGQPQNAPEAIAPIRKRMSWRRAVPVAAVAAALMIAGVFVWQGLFRDSHSARPVATFGSQDRVQWVGVEVPQDGEGIRAGQKIEIAAGRVRIDFANGATVTLVGPAMFEVLSETAAFLALGQLEARADTPASRGFTLRTRTAEVVDLGTEFSAEAGVDGQSRVEVRSGAVEVTASDQRHLLRTGDLLLVEPGASRVVVRIERGDSTPAFHFPSIEPPSREDFVDQQQGRARATVAKGSLLVHRSVPLASSGPVEALLDGRGQSGQDAPRESVYFDNKSEGGMILLDLGSAMSVTKVNTYSWHQNQAKIDNRLRAQQQYVLYGFAGDVPPSTDEPLEAAGWSRIARVNTDEFFGVATRLDRPAQQACSITSAAGSLGRFRYLLWDVKPSRLPDFKILNHTFYGEFDVYARP